jgi:3-dehydroquinate synthetase
MTLPAGAATAVGLDRTLQFGDHSYPYALRCGSRAWDDLAARAAALDADRFFVVAAEGLPAEVERLVTGCFSASAPVTVLRVPGGENSKNLLTVSRLAAQAAGTGITRRSVFAGVGGGQAGNIAGYIAGNVLRGDTRLVHVPTTALAVWDSTPSLKQAVNLELGDGEEGIPAKNLVGCFKKPEFVWANLDVLGYLPAEEIRSGIGEAVKNVVAICPDQAGELTEILRPLADYLPEELCRIAALCVDAKQQVMRHDPEEKGPALACEYGHTCGHLFEARLGIPHGLAIGVGGLVAGRAARLLGIAGDDVEGAHEELLRAAGAPVTVPPLPDGHVREVVYRDNKRGYLPPRRGHVDMVLLERPGTLHQPAGARRRDGQPVPLTQVPEAVVLEAIRSRAMEAA